MSGIHHPPPMPQYNTSTGTLWVLQNGGQIASSREQQQQQNNPAKGGTQISATALLMSSCSNEKWIILTEVTALMLEEADENC